MSPEPEGSPSDQSTSPAADTGERESARVDTAEKDSSKTTREWLQLSLNGLAAIGAIFLFLRYDSRNRELTNQLTALNLERNQLEFQALKARKVEIAKALISTPLMSKGQTGYKIDFQYSIKNASAQPVEVTNALIEVYVGEFAAAGNEPTTINPPRQPGAIRWRSVLKRAHFVTTKWVRGCYIESDDPDANPRDIDALEGGGGTGRLGGGEASQDGIVLFIPARGANLVAFLVTVTLDNRDGRRFGIIDNPAHPSSLPKAVSAGE